MISRGRLSLYKVLYTEKKLSNHLVETSLFSKSSLFEFLEKYLVVVIKPAFGPGKLIISCEKNAYKIISNTTVSTIIDREEMYRHLMRNELREKFYIIQPQKLASRFSPYFYSFFITVNRKSSFKKWKIASITKHNRTFIGKVCRSLYYHKIKRISLLVANKLGEHFPECHTIVIETVCDVTSGIWISDSVLHLPISKWDQYQSLRKKYAISSFVPKTDTLTQFTFSNYLNKYNEIILKPCQGQHGIGVVQIKKENPSTYEIHHGIRTLKKRTLAEAYSYIQENYLTKKDYLIQQRIPLATIDDCPIDVRVITQKIASDWEVTGRLVKVAGKDFFITNAAQKLLTLENALQESSISQINTEKLKAKIDKVCLLAAKQLEKGNEKINIIGFDIGITNKKDVWIIEGNYVPDLTMFNKHGDQQMFRNILNARKE